MRRKTEGNNSSVSCPVGGGGGGGGIGTGHHRIKIDSAKSRTLSAPPPPLPPPPQWNCYDRLRFYRFASNPPSLGGAAEEPGLQVRETTASLVKLEPFSSDCYGLPAPSQEPPGYRGYPPGLDWRPGFSGAPEAAADCWYPSSTDYPQQQHCLNRPRWTTATGAQNLCRIGWNTEDTYRYAAGIGLADSGGGSNRVGPDALQAPPFYVDPLDKSFGGIAYGANPGDVGAFAFGEYPYSQFSSSYVVATAHQNPYNGAMSAAAAVAAAAPTIGTSMMTLDPCYAPPPPPSFTYYDPLYMNGVHALTTGGGGGGGGDRSLSACHGTSFTSMLSESEFRVYDRLGGPPSITHPPPGFAYPLGQPPPLRSPVAETPPSRRRPFVADHRFPPNAVDKSTLPAVTSFQGHVQGHATAVMTSESASDERHRYDNDDRENITTQWNETVRANHVTPSSSSSSSSATSSDGGGGVNNDVPAASVIDFKAFEMTFGIPDLCCIGECAVDEILKTTNGNHLDFKFEPNVTCLQTTT